MDFENSKTPQEMAQIKKERAISDTELLKGGAEYEIDSQGNEGLSLTNAQVEGAKKEMDEDLNKKNIESKIENLTSDEKAYFDIKTELFKSLDNIEKLAKNGKIDKETESQMRQTIFDMQSKSASPMFENLGVDLSQREEKSGEIVKLAREAFNNQKMEAPDQDKENQIKQESKETNSEDILDEIIKNEKLQEVLQRESGDNGNVERLLAHGASEYEKDLKQKLGRFMREFPAEQDFIAKEKFGSETEKIIRSAKTEMDSGRNVEFNKNKLKDLEKRMREEQGSYGWENKFGESYKESLKEFQKLLYEGHKKYQEEKNKKTEKCISDVKNFDDLMRVVKASGGIQGSQDFFKPKDIGNFFELRNSLY